jgi:transposase
LLILDGGVASKNNLAQLRAAGIQYLVNDSRRRRAVWRAEFARDESFTLLPGREGRSAVRVKLLDLPTQERLVLCKSAGRKDKENAIRSGAEQHLRAALTKLDQRLKAGQLQAPEKIQRVIGRVLGQHPRVQRYYNVSLRDATRPTAGLQWDRNDEQYQADGDLAGCYVLRTDRTGLSAEETWRLYVTLTNAEEAFAALKGDLGLRPNYHQLETRVDAHIFITVLAYHLWKFISHTLARSGDHRDWVTVRRVLQTHCYATVHVPTREGITYHLRKPGQAEACQAELYQRFGIDLASLPRTKVVTQTKVDTKAKVDTPQETTAIL